MECACEDAQSQHIFDQIFSAIKSLFCHQFSIIELMDILIAELDNCAWSDYERHNWLCIVLCALGCSSTPRQDKIVAFELIGASCILLCESSLGLSCWKFAMELRYLPVDGGPHIPNIPAQIQSDMLSDKVFGTAVEVTSMEQLEQWFNNIVNTTREVIEVQALLVYRRISSQQTRPYFFYLKTFLDYGRALKKRREYNRSINIYHFILEQIAVFEPDVACPERLVAIFHDTFVYMLKCFQKMLNIPIDSPEREELSSANLLKVIKFCTTIGKFFSITQRQESCYFNSHTDTDYPKLTYDFVMMLDSISPQLNGQEKEQLRESLSVYSSTVVSFFLDDFTTYPLHGALYKKFNLKYIQLLLDCGADPNAYDFVGKSPLHVLASRWISSEVDAYCSGVFRALMNAGAHLDNADSEGETIVSILKGRRQSERSCDVDSVINTIFPLSCHCARVIRKHGIPFEDQLPPSLQNFVRQHSAKGF